MGNKAQTPTANPENLVLGAGAIYFNYGLTGEAAIGATRGGSSFNANREFREVEQDGTYGPVKGMKRKVRVAPVLTVNALEMNEESIGKYYAGMDVDNSNADYFKVTERIDIEDTDYIDNVAFVGETQDGEDVVIIIENVLGDGNLELAIEDKNEIVPEIQFTAHYDPETPKTVPYEIRFPKRA